MVQISSNGEIIKDISTYPKINICSHQICSGLQKSSDPLSLLPNVAIQTCRINFVYIVSTFGFLFTAFAHRLSINLCIYMSGQKWKNEVLYYF